MRCAKFVRVGVDRSCRCPYPAKWQIVSFTGRIVHYCGIHTRSWQLKQPGRVRSIKIEV